MAKLKLVFNGEVLDEYELDREEISIGRRPENDIQIDNLAVSGRHARVLTILNDSFLEDLGSTNGTYVNGSVVKKHPLKNGDVISLGKHELHFASETASGADDFERTMIIRPDAAGMPESTGSNSLDQSMGEMGAQIIRESRQASSDGPGKARIRVISGTNAGKELEITKALTTLGKPGHQVAAVTRRPKGFYIVHVEGDDTTPPTLDGEPIGRNACPLGDNAVIEVAGVRMEFLLDPE
ncbi:MAG: FHA domain-containing protein [Spiribacter salinus]|uniref:FHA domain-containing protein n=1 Tax=Spiribacter salinus TaxID=1335746 RepID=A0A540VJ07_9GAMM|nr:MAG: FHA domain-containing protein [Spiribacter salinus]